MKAWRGVRVLMSVLSGLVVGCGPVPEGGVEGEVALESEGAIGTVTAAVAKEPAPGLMAHRWEVCEDRAERVRDIRPGPAGSRPESLVQGNGRLVFSADDGAHGRELWVTVGEGRHTTLLKDVRPGAPSSVPRSLTSVGQWVFFVADDGAHGPELWRTNGTEQGTVLVKDVRPGGVGSAPDDLTVVGNLLYFTADDGERGRELWRTDGTERGTVLVRDFAPGADTSFPVELTAWDGGLALVTYGATETSLWFVDKRARVSRLFSDTEQGTLFRLTAAGRQLFFLRDPNLGEGELWVTRGVPGTATRVRHFPGEYPDWLTAMGDVVYFQAGAEGLFGNPGDPLHGGELWRSDGTQWGTWVVRDIQPGPGGSLPSELVAVEGVLYFAADDGRFGRELWRSDGTPWGTWLVRDIEPGPAGSNPEELTGEEEWVFFSAFTSAHGREVWYSNGRPWDTKQLMDIAPGPASANPDHFRRSGWDVFFLADNGMRDQELYAVPFRPTLYCGGRW